MPDDKIQDLARIFATIVEEHGVKAAIAALPRETQIELDMYYNGLAAQMKRDVVKNHGWPYDVDQEKDAPKS